MDFSLSKAFEIIERTPDVLTTMLQNISPEWATNNEGRETWSAYDVVGHLIHAERTDWITRMDVILSEGEEKTFPPFDRFAKFEESKGKTLTQLLEEFKTVRNKNIQYVRSLDLTQAQLDKRGIHPAFGEVTLQQLLSTWAVHDLNHIAQICRVMAKQYTSEVGPWVDYLRILKS